MADLKDKGLNGGGEGGLKLTVQDEKCTNSHDTEQLLNRSTDTTTSFVTASSLNTNISITSMSDYMVPSKLYSDIVSLKQLV